MNPGTYEEERRGTNIMRFPNLGFFRFVLPSLVLATAFARPAHAEENLIRQPNEHPSYIAEVEPHALLGYGGAFGPGGLGIGARASFRVVQNGFIPQLNNSVAVTTGLDFMPTAGGRFFIPVGMQWNFWMSTHFSVFGEPGIGIATKGANYIHPLFTAGGRYNFTERIAITVRIGYPTVSAGVSFFL
ncbi:MAG: hypothetical protein U0169_15340 [Polyangiaceae bacterium]